MPPPDYVFKRTHQFKKSFEGLSDKQQQAIKEAFKKFKLNPFDPSLKTHKINRLSALRKTNVFSVVIESDLRVIFTLNGNVVISEDVGSHDIYK